MESSAMRALAGPRRRALRRTLLTILGMTAMVVGLLAMHSAGAEHPSSVPLPGASATATHSGPGGVAGMTDATVLPMDVATTAPPCDEVCVHGAVDGALMAMSCAMLLLFAALVLFATRRAVFRHLLDAGRRIVWFAENVPLHLRRPDLTVLSISRT